MDWMKLLYDIFQIALIPLLGAATIYLVTLIHAKKKQLQEQTKSDTVKKYLDMLDKTICECVIATNQTYVNALKAAGSFDIEAQKEAFKLTYDAVLAILTDDAKEYLTVAIGDLNTYITSKIETEVVMTKALPA